MLIVADENIPLLDAFFAGFGEIRRYPGRAIDAACVAQADLLLVRSVTRVDRALLAGSRVRFVGTCTIGTDHLDTDYFEAAGIAWSSAPGCNARGVVDYVLGCLQLFAEQTGQPLAERRYGVVGAGQVGGRLVRLLRGLGWSVQVCDPPRAAVEGGDYQPLEQLLDECNVISLHTPLDAGSRHLLHAGNLPRLRPGSWLINAARGAVVDNRALKAHLQAGSDLQVALDVWEGEPQVDVELAALCRVATPHIAGYSLDGKLRGTAQIYQAYCRASGQPEQVQLADWLPPRWLDGLSLHPDTPLDWALARLVQAIYQPTRDHHDFLRSLDGDARARAAAFDALRKHYPVRRELEGLQLQLPAAATALAQLAVALGCQLR